MKTHGFMALVAALLFWTGPALAVGFDHDDDGDVDLDDYEAFAVCLDGPDAPVASGCEGFDSDVDLHVDLFDFVGFQREFGSVAPPDPTKVQLAGNSLSGYPYFEFARAFHEDATVEVAIDPTQYPEIIGQTCDIYVVSAKTGGEWVVDPSLVDVRVDGPQTESFGGSTIQDNTFTVADPFELSAYAGAGLGVGYDIVLDCDQNGQLSSADYIDGLGREAGLYVVADTTEPGPYAVTEVIYSGGTWLGQDTYYPTNIGTMEQ
ncbi:MAG: hypothetical protein JSV78_02360, partial [Phycisphaerales bacterium]